MSDPTFIGTVQDVSGSTIGVILDTNTLSGLVFVNGQGYRIGQVGSFVRIPIGYANLYGIVSKVGASSVPESISQSNPYGQRWMTVELIGESTKNRNFIRGLSQTPAIGDSVHLVTENELDAIYSVNSPSHVSIGHLSSSESIPAMIDVNKMIVHHCAVVGSTGSGKSTTVAGLISTLANEEQFPSSRILVFDIHGEYGKALRNDANVFRVNARKGEGEHDLYLPYWALTFDELLPLILGNINDSDRGQISEKITQMKLESESFRVIKDLDVNSVTVDTPVPFSIHQFWFDIHRDINATHTVQKTEQKRENEALLLDEKKQPIEEGNALKVIPPKYRPQCQSANEEKIYLANHSTLNIRKQIDFLASKLRDPRYDFMFQPGAWLPDDKGNVKKDLDDLLKSWMGSDKPVTVIDLSGIPNSILSQIIGVFLRIIFDALFWSKNLPVGGKMRPLLVVLEEAHTYLFESQNNLASVSIRRLVKEGRKYGIGAMIVSQRPSEIDTTILSQCGTIVSLRLTNSTDRSCINSVVSENLLGLLSMLPILRTGEALIIGEAVHLPLRSMINSLPRDKRPDSDDPKIFDSEEKKGWNKPKSEEDYKIMLKSWRNQRSFTQEGKNG